MFKTGINFTGKWMDLCIRVVGDLSGIKHSSITVERKHWSNH